VFEDVPARLAIFVRDWVKPGADRNLMYLEAAGAVIREYTGKSVFEPEPDKFFNAEIVNDAEEYSAHYPMNVIRLAETLFALRKAEGFDHLCRRFAERNLRSTYFEASVARTFSRGGLAPCFRAEIGEKKKDFDFVAVRGGEAVNVEVTALTAPRFSTNTINNALNEKRKQLPPCNASVIVCVIPEAWAHQGVDLNAEIGRAARRFFGGSERVNVLMFAQERHVSFVSDGSRGMFGLIHQAFRHLAPRQTTTLLDFLFSSSPIYEAKLFAYIEVLAAMGEQAQLEWVMEGMRTSEFYAWVDSIHPKPGAGNGG
jgi:hypothetical protein